MGGRAKRTVCNRFQRAVSDLTAFAKRVKSESNRFHDPIAHFNSCSGEIGTSVNSTTGTVRGAKGDCSMSKTDYSRREFLQRSAGMAGVSLIGGDRFLESRPFFP